MKIKIRRIYLATLIILFSGMLLSGCGKKEKSELIGTWKAVEIKINDVLYTDEYELDIVYYLKEDKTFSGVTVNEDIYGTYQVRASEVTFTYENGDKDLMTLEDGRLIGEAGDIKVILEKQ